MDAAGKVYYDDDKVAFVENQKGEIETLMLFAKNTSSSVLTCPRTSLSAEHKESKYVSPRFFNLTTDTKENNKAPSRCIIC